MPVTQAWHMTLRRTIALIVAFGLVASVAIIFGAWMTHTAIGTASERNVAIRLDALRLALGAVGDRSWASDMREAMQLARTGKSAYPAFAGVYRPGHPVPGITPEVRKDLDLRLSAKVFSSDDLRNWVSHTGSAFEHWAYYRGSSRPPMAVKVDYTLPAAHKMMDRRVALLGELYDVRLHWFVQIESELPLLRRTLRQWGVATGPHSIMESGAVYGEGEQLAMVNSTSYSGHLLVALANRSELGGASLNGYTLAGGTMSVLGMIWGGAIAWIYGTRRQHELALRQSNFVASVSHELRTPLTAIRASAEMLSLDMVPPAKQGAYYQAILTEADRLGRMVEQILDFDRLQRGQFTIDRQPTELAGVVERVAEIMRPVASKREVDLEVLIDEPLTVQADPDTTAQALTNLIDNAIKFSPKGTAVRIRLERRQETVVLAVEDSGAGVPPRERSKIFEAFYRAGDETTRQTKGSGLGLYLVRRYMEAVGGRITVTDAEGMGARFAMEWPRV